MHFAWFCVWSEQFSRKQLLPPEDPDEDFLPLKQNFSPSTALPTASSSVNSTSSSISSISATTAAALEQARREAQHSSAVARGTVTHGTVTQALAEEAELQQQFEEQEVCYGISYLFSYKII